MKQKDMGERQKYFKKALSDFTLDAASGGAIRHLADRGYTASQIVKMLDFPTPYDRVQRTIWEHYLASGVLRLEEPGGGNRQEKYGYVTDYDPFGRKSLRRVLLEQKEPEPEVWQELQAGVEKKDWLPGFLKEKSERNGRDFSYVSCDFGLQARRDPKAYDRRLEKLPPALQDYIQGLPWERRLVYHRLDERMQEIVAGLFACGEYQGTCYFIKTGEKLRLL